jgi:hypothetical protein
VSESPKRRHAAPPHSGYARVLPVILLVAGVAVPSDAGKSTFNPQVTFGVNYTDNVAFVTGESGDSEPTQSREDVSSRLRLFLPYTNEMKRSSLRLAYETGYRAYRVYEQLNFLGHRLSFVYETTPRRKHSLGIFTNLVMTQDQGNATRRTEDDVDFFLSERTERKYIDFGVRYQHRINARWRWDTTVAASMARFESIEGLDAPDVEPTVENRNAYRFAVGFNHYVSSRDYLGGRYRFQLSELETTGNEKFHSLSLTAGREFSKDFSLGLELGGYKRQRDDTEETSPSDFRDEGLYASVAVGYARPVGPLRLGFVTGVTPTTGGSLAGTSTNVTAALNVTQVTARVWDWSASTRYTRRIPSDRSIPTTDTSSLNGSITRGLTNLLGINFYAAYAKQTVVDEAPEDYPRSTGSFFTVGLGLVWYPLGRMRIARGF